MTTSEINKTKKQLLAATDVAKCKVCWYIIDMLSGWSSRYYVLEQKNHFLDLCQAKDFNEAVDYFVNTMLPSLKKADKIEYNSVLLLCMSNIVMTHNIAPNSKDVIDKALAESHYWEILKGLQQYIRKASFHQGIDNVLYLLWEVARRPKEEVPAGVKRCVFHLLAQYQASRKDGKYAKRYAKDTLIYLQDKYHCFNEDDPLEMAVLQGTVRKTDFKQDWDAFINPKGSKTIRLTINDIRQRMGEMDERHAEEVHHLFMTNYIDYSDYEFRDEWMLDGYLECHHEYFRSGGRYLEELNEYVLDILREWQQDANHKYQKAKKDIVWWMEDPIPEFKPSLEHEIDSAVKSADDTDDDETVVKALMPFPQKIADIISAGNYEDAAANIYYLFDYLAAFEKKHEPWFKSVWHGGPMSKMACFFDVLCELYCHLRQLKDVPLAVRNEMDIHLEIFNRKTYFFGDMCCNSRFEDLVLDGKKQFNDYSVLEECGMWREWYFKKYKIVN